jgi:hypothetical protein
VHNRFATAPLIGTVNETSPNKNGEPWQVPHRACSVGAGNESRTRDLNLGKVALYQLSYSRIAPLDWLCARIIGEVRAAAVTPGGGETQAISA